MPARQCTHRLTGLFGLKCHTTFGPRPAGTSAAAKMSDVYFQYG